MKIQPKRIFVALAVLSISILPTTPNVLGQQINVATPFNTASSSFHERFGVNFGFSLAGGRGPGSRVVGLSPGGQITPNINFSQNLGAGTVPAFGGFSPNGGARFGFRQGRPGGPGFSLGFNFSQGSSRTLTSATPSVTVANGGIGTFQSGFIRPFVTGVTPVVGYYPDNAVTRAIAHGGLKPYSTDHEPKIAGTSAEAPPKSSISSASRADIGVAEIKAQKRRARELRHQNLERIVAEAKRLEHAGKFRDARNSLRTAIQLASDPIKIKELKAWLKRLRSKR